MILIDETCMRLHLPLRIIFSRIFQISHLVLIRAKTFLVTMLQLRIVGVTINVILKKFYDFVG